MTAASPGRAPQSNFAYAFLFLSRDQRRAIEQVYRFCRVVDDVADDDGLSLDQKRAGLDGWATELARCYDGLPARALTRELQWAIQRFGLRRSYFEELLAGVGRDLVQTRYGSYAALGEYCYGVAGTVGLLCIQIFGLDTARYHTYAVLLGKALQMTNVLRDVRADAVRGRIYLPREDLERFGCAETEILAQRDSQAFRRLMAFEYDRTRALYAEARALILPADRRRLVGAEIMTAIYRELLERIAASGFDVLRREIRVGRWRRLWIAAGVWAGRRPQP